MTRGFSLIEILIAIAVAASTIIAVSLVSYGTPRMLQNAVTELEAGDLTHARAMKDLITARNHFDILATAATTTDGPYSVSHIVQHADDDAAKRISDRAQWHTDESPRSITSESVVFDFRNAASYPCDPFLSGDWRSPRVVGSYVFAPGQLLPASIPAGTYPISGLAITGSTLAISIGSTVSATDPTLFFFRLGSPEDQPRFLPPAFDNATSSRTGFTTVATGPGTVYAANGFSSASACMTTSAECSQVHIFEVSGPIPARASLVRIPSAYPTHAVTPGGAMAPGSTLTYRDGYLYLGLTKTAGGQEFQMLDVKSSTVPRIIGGFTVGRGVNSIVTDDITAYLATDDNRTGGKAIIAVDVHDPAHIIEDASYSFPGAGYTRYVVRDNSRLYIGRSYAAGTSEEFPILDRISPTLLTRVGGVDIGTSRVPASVHGIILRDFLAFILTDSALQLWDIHAGLLPTSDRYASISIPHGTATAFVCHDNVLYVGSTGSDGTGYLTVITSS